MKKISFYLTLLFRNTINEQVDASQLAQEVFNLIKSKNALRTLEIITAFEKVAEQEMRKEEQRCAEVCRAVNSKWVPETKKATYLELLVKDPVFESPIKNKIA